MLKTGLLIVLLFPATFFAQVKSESGMSPSLWLGIWDNVKQIPAFNLNAIGYNDIPRDVFFRGILVECLEFDDANGHNLLILTQTGMFPVSTKNAEGVYEKQGDNAEIYAYLYTRQEQQTAYTLTWSVFEEQGCNDFDLYIGFTKKSLSVTDLNNDGKAEISFQLTQACRSDVSPSDRHLYFLQPGQKVVYSGQTEIEGIPSEKPVIEEKPAASAEIKDFLQKKWNQFGEDPFLQFYYSEE